MGTHTHSQAPRERARRALRVALALNFAFLGLETVIAFISGSLALLSDAAHMVSDVAALALALLASEFALRPAVQGRTYGFARAEALGAFANALFLAFACALIVHSAIGRLSTGDTHFEPEPVLVVGVAGLVVNLASAWYLARSGGDNLNIRGALIHMLADALGSLGAIVAAVLASTWAIHSADSILSLGIAVLVLFSAWGVLRDATRALLDFAPTHLPQERVEAELRGLAGLSEIHELHLWSVGGAPVLTAHLVPEPGVAPGDLLARAEHVLREHLGVVHTTLQIDDPGPCAQRRCPLFDEQLAQLRPHGHGHGHSHGHGHAH
ncbi:cation diffusion facilitator family transporter [Nannocystis pusilla]|uniref:cation diffusion facilitator family transporter n=1 Tax=Nannocystis pusilla TaxID=889268 RepID=UPI003B7816FD